MATPSEPDSRKPMRVAVVGPCAAGKSTLSQSLKSFGYTVRQPAQEHSYVPDMWQRISQPDVLIYLDVDYASVKRRRPLGNDQQRLLIQQQRLTHARQHCDFYLNTSLLSAEEVCQAVTMFLRHLNDPNNS